MKWCRDRHLRVQSERTVESAGLLLRGRILQILRRFKPNQSVQGIEKYPVTTAITERALGQGPDGGRPGGLPRPGPVAGTVVDTRDDNR